MWTHLKSDLHEQLRIVCGYLFHPLEELLLRFFLCLLCSQSILLLLLLPSTILLSQHLPLLILLPFRFEEVKPPLFHHGLKFLDVGLDIILEEHDAIVIKFSEFRVDCLELADHGILHKKLVITKI
jgi:hypothetical protein